MCIIHPGIGNAMLFDGPIRANSFCHQEYSVHTEQQWNAPEQCSGTVLSVLAQEVVQAGQHRIQDGGECSESAICILVLWIL